MSMRINLDPHMDAEILAVVRETANGGSEPKALVFLVRHWYRLAQLVEIRPELAQFGAHDDPNCANSGQNEGAKTDDFEVALDSIDDIFS